MIYHRHAAPVTSQRPRPARRGARYPRAASGAGAGARCSTRSDSLTIVCEPCRVDVLVDEVESGGLQMTKLEVAGCGLRAAGTVTTWPARTYGTTCGTTSGRYCSFGVGCVYLSRVMSAPVSALHISAFVSTLDISSCRLTAGSLNLSNSVFTPGAGRMAGGVGVPGESGCMVPEKARVRSRGRARARARARYATHDWGAHYFCATRRCSGTRRRLHFHRISTV